MGAWGAGIFENDDACDFAGAVAQDSNLKRIETALDKVLNVGSEYLEAPDSSEALAAADIVARLRGKFGQQDAYTEQLDKWVENNRAKLAPPDGLVEKARRVALRVTTAPSELAELWEESDEMDFWKASISELLERLS